VVFCVIGPVILVLLRIFASQRVSFEVSFEKAGGEPSGGPGPNHVCAARGRCRRTDLHK
jgi:hypothetical protein